MNNRMLLGISILLCTMGVVTGIEAAFGAPHILQALHTLGGRLPAREVEVVGIGALMAVILIVVGAIIPMPKEIKTTTATD